MPEEYFLYILWSEQLKKYYVGSSANIEKRLSEHNSGKAKFTSKGIPWVIVLYIKYDSKKEAQEMERHVKRMKSKKYIQDLIQHRKNSN